jgi:hypothetical protein
MKPTDNPSGRADDKPSTDLLPFGAKPVNPNSAAPMCSVVNCRGEPVARGLCAKHYMRWRRAGDPTETRRPGRPRDVLHEEARDIGPSMSARTRSRWAAARRLLGYSAAAEAAFKAAYRPDGGINVSAVLEIAHAAHALPRPRLSAAQVWAHPSAEGLFNNININRHWAQQPPLTREQATERVRGLIAREERVRRATARWLREHDPPHWRKRR